MEERFVVIKRIVEKELACSAHDMDHVERVLRLCIQLAEGQDVDMDILQAAALLHDIARVREDSDSSGRTDHAVLGAEMAGPVLREAGFPEEKIVRVQDCIRTHRYRAGDEPGSLEAKILFDADKLDALGAIGMARAFVWVGRNGARIYADVDVDEYAESNLSGDMKGRIRDKTMHSPQIEYETKTKFLPGRLFTERAKEIAVDRLNFCKRFLDRLEKEVAGER